MRLLLKDVALDVAAAVHGDIDIVVDVETVAAETVAAVAAVVAVHLDAVAVAVDVVVAVHLDAAAADVAAADVFVAVDFGVAQTS